jgi:uncharacterized protein (TIRG00374 family)
VLHIECKEAARVFSKKVLTKKRVDLSEAAVYGLAFACLTGLFVVAGKTGLSRLSRPSWPGLLGALVVTYIFMEAMAIRYWAVLGMFSKGGRPGHLTVLFSTVFGMTAGLIFSRGAGQMVAKPMMLSNQEGFPITESIYASVLERVTDLLTGMFLCIPLLLKLLGAWKSFPEGDFILFWLIWLAWGGLSLLYIHGILRGVNWVLGSITRILTKWGLLGEGRLSRAMSVFNETLRPWRSARERTLYTLCSMSRVILISLRILFLSIAFRIAMPWEILILGVPLVQISLLLSFTPGSLGFLEAGWYAVLSMQGVPHQDIWSLLLGLRVTNYLFFPLITFCVWVIYCRYGQKAAQGVNAD